MKMKSSFHTKLWAVALVLALALGVQAAGASPVDAALDRDQEFLDSLADLADRMERGQLNGEWFFHEKPQGVTGQAPLHQPSCTLKKVSATAFYGMGTLTEVLIPESLTEVEFDGNLEPDPNHPYSGLLTQTWAFLGTSLPLATQARLKKMGYYGSFR